MGKLSDRLRSARKNCLIPKPMTLTDLSKATGIGQGTISRYENGEITPSNENLAKIADALGLRVEQFFTDEEAP